MRIVLGWVVTHPCPAGAPKMSEIAGKIHAAKTIRCFEWASRVTARVPIHPVILKRAVMG